jgi:uncharacterized membrane protein
VFAIALTLLVLGLRSDATRGTFLHAMAHQWPSYVAYFAAFLNISAIWINHHDLFSRVKHVDNPLLALNLISLFVASVFSWPAAVIGSAIRRGDHHDQVFAVTLFAGIGFTVPLSFIVLYGYLFRKPQPLEETADVAYMRAGIKRALISVVLYPLTVLLAVLLSPAVALGLFVAIPGFVIAAMLLQHEPLHDNDPSHRLI